MTLEFVEQLFPAFAEIQNVDMRTRAETAMRMAMEHGGWNEENIHLAPVSLSWKGCEDVSWVEHTRDVTEMCILEFDLMKKYYQRHGVAFDRDLVVVGALLHDIGKLTEFVYSENGTVHGPNWQLMRHPLSGALIASKAGLSDEVIHLIATHSFEGDRSYHTLESDFVRTVDIFVFNCSVKGLEKR